MELNKCLDAIKEHAFVSSPYPVILTLEDHLTPPLQAKVAKVPFSIVFSLSEPPNHSMATLNSEQFPSLLINDRDLVQLIKQKFGDMLFISESEQMAEFPSPDDLKGKIIVSTKPPKEYLQTKSGKEEDKTEGGVWGEEISGDNATAGQARTLTITISRRMCFCL